MKLSKLELYNNAARDIKKTRMAGKSFLEEEWERDFEIPPRVHVKEDVHGSDGGKNLIVLDISR